MFYKIVNIRQFLIVNVYQLWKMYKQQNLNLFVVVGIPKVEAETL